MKRKKQITLLLLMVQLVVTTIAPLYGFDMRLQHIGTLILFFILGRDIQKQELSWRAYLGISIFTALHIFGARWLYTNVPYQEWFLDYLNWDINATFGWERNHYDRLVHFTFGASFVIPAYDYLKQKISFNKLSALFAWTLVQTASMVYELFEWGLTFLLSPDAVENYNGQQGDIWDPHKDMALAALASLIVIMLLRWYDHRRKNV